MCAQTRISRNVELVGVWRVPYTARAIRVSTGLRLSGCIAARKCARKSSMARRADTGEHLASRGFFVVMPQFRCGFLRCNHERASNGMVATIDRMLERAADPASIRFERIDPGHIYTSSHSAGGLWSLVAASTLTAPPSWTDQACALGASGAATLDPGPKPPG
jgi:hypothetical protein